MSFLPVSSAESIISWSKFLQLFSLTLCHYPLHSQAAPPNTLYLLLMSPNRDNDYKVVSLYKSNLEGLSVVVHSISIAGVSVLVVFPTSEERASVIITEAKTSLWSRIDFFLFPSEALPGSIKACLLFRNSLDWETTGAAEPAGCSGKLGHLLGNDNHDSSTEKKEVILFLTVLWEWLCIRTEPNGKLSFNSNLWFLLVQTWICTFF